MKTSSILIDIISENLFNNIKGDKHKIYVSQASTNSKKQYICTIE